MTATCLTTVGSLLCTQKAGSENENLAIGPGASRVWFLRPQGQDVVKWVSIWVSFLGPPPSLQGNKLLLHNLST